MEPAKIDLVIRPGREGIFRQKVLDLLATMASNETGTASIRVSNKVILLTWVSKPAEGLTEGGSDGRD